MQPLLLLHGAIGTSDQLKKIKNNFDSKYDVHLINFSGHGGQPFSDVGFSISVFAEEIAAYIEENKLERVNIFGYSMGGYVAMYLVRKYPSKINKIVTLATKFHWDVQTAKKETKMLDPLVIEEKVPKFAQTLAKRHAPNDWKELLNKTAIMLQEMGEENPLSLTDYESIETPSMILIGDRDSMITLEETVNVCKALPNAQMGMIPATKHPIEQTNLKYLLYHIRKFLED